MNAKQNKMGASKRCPFYYSGLEGPWL